MTTLDDAPVTRRVERLRKLPKPPKTVENPLALRAVHGNIATTRDTATAWFVIPGQHWPFVADQRRLQMVLADAARYTALVGHRAQIRVTSTPLDVLGWARRLRDDSPHRLPGFDAHQISTQEHLLARGGAATKTVYLGVRLAGRGWWERVAAMLGQTTIATPEWETLTQQARAVEALLNRGGSSAAPATDTQMEALLHRSVALGCPIPVTVTSSGVWETDDLLPFADTVEYVTQPRSPTVVVRAARGGRIIEHHVAVLTVGRFDSILLADPGKAPWMHAADGLGFPVEWASTVDLLGAEPVRKHIGKHLLRIRAQQAEYVEHDIDVPLDLGRKADHARDVEHTLTDGAPMDRAAAFGWHRLAVWADTREECLHRVADVQAFYRDEYQIEMVHPYTLTAGSQLDLMREFVPGEPVASSAYLRRMPVAQFAAGMPHVTAQVGDGRGPYLAATAGVERRPVFYDPHHAPESSKSGVTVLVCEPGGGKSSTLARIVIPAVRRGVSSTILDPSGPLGRLTEIPDLAPYSRAVNLLEAPPGGLSVYAAVPDPRPSDFDTDQALVEAQVEARATRRMMASEILAHLLPDNLLAQAETTTALADAIRSNGDSPDRSLDGILDILAGGSSHEKMLARTIGDYRDMPKARAFFGSDPDPGKVLAADATLLVLTMPGIDIPDPSIPKRDQTMQQRLAHPLLLLAHWLVMRRIYSLPRHQRKLFAGDEVGQTMTWAAGVALMNRVARDSRKWNLAALFASQHPSDILRVPKIEALTSSAFIGVIGDEATAEEALHKFARVRDPGHAATVTGLSPRALDATGASTNAPREFLFRDVTGRVARVTVDFGDDPELLAYLATDATRG